MKKYMLATWVMTLITVFACLSSIELSYGGSQTELLEESELCTTEDSFYLRYHDIITTLLIPTIRDHARQVYEGDFKIAQNYMNIKRVERMNGFRTFDFLIKLEVMPYRDNYRIIGLDHVTIKLTHDNTVEMVQYDHIRDY